MQLMIAVRIEGGATITFSCLRPAPFTQSDQVQFASVSQESNLPSVVDIVQSLSSSVGATSLMGNGHASKAENRSPRLNRLTESCLSAYRWACEQYRDVRQPPGLFFNRCSTLNMQFFLEREAADWSEGHFGGKENRVQSNWSLTRCPFDISNSGSGTIRLTLTNLLVQCAQKSEGEGATHKPVA